MQSRVSALLKLDLACHRLAIVQELHIRFTSAAESYNAPVSHISACKSLFSKQLVGGRSARRLPVF